MLARTHETAFRRISRQAHRRDACATITVLAVAVLTVSGCARHATQATPRAKPNILLIVVDTLRADRLACYGYGRPTSPNIDALAAEGVLFRDAMAAASETAASVPSLLTSRRPREHGVLWAVRNGEVWVGRQLQARTLAEALRANGYVTAAVSANRLIGPVTGTSKGFDSFDQSVAQVWPQNRTAAEVNARAEAWLRGYDQRKGPFFLYLQYMDPHFPYKPPSPFCGFGRPGFLPEDERANAQLEKLFLEYGKSAVSEPLLEKWRLSREDIDRLSDLYDGEVACVDHHIGLLLKQLRLMGLYDNTIVVLTADHGESFLEHGRLEHGVSLYQELLHVPLIMKLPGVRGGQEVRELVESIDVAPTVLDAAGLGGAMQASGRSLYRSVATGTPIPSRLAIAELPGEKAYAVREGAMKLITSPARTELYDLSHDPEERHDLAPSQPEEVTRLSAALQEELARHPAAPTNLRPASPQEVEALKALGYLR